MPARRINKKILTIVGACAFFAALIFFGSAKSAVAACTTCPDGWAPSGEGCAPQSGVGFQTCPASPPPSGGIGASATPAQGGSEDGCSFGLTRDFDKGACIRQLLYDLALAPAALLMGFAGLALNAIIEFTIIGFSAFIERNSGELGAVTVAWTLFRDILNMVFIFLLLYLGIKTVLGDNSYQKLIPKIVIAGLLINFSFFFTSVLIDISNVATVELYKSIEAIGESVCTDTSSPACDGQQNLVVRVDGLSGAFTNGLRPRIIRADSTNLALDVFQVAFAFLTYAVAAFVFLVMCAMLLVRFLILILLLITSPIAVMGELLPQLDKEAKKWWGQLWNQLLFAPVFMLFMLVVVLIINSSGFLNSINIQVPKGNSSTVGDIVANILSPVMSYTLAIGLIIMGLITSKQFAGSAGKGFSDWAGKKAGALAFGTSAWVGRKTIGRAGAGIADSGRLNAIAARGGFSGLMAQGLIRSGKWTGNASFDARGVDALGNQAGAGKAAEGFIKHREAEKKEYAGYMKKAAVANPEVVAAKKNLGVVQEDAAKKTREAQQQFAAGDITRSQLDATQQQQRERVQRAREGVTTVKRARQNLRQAGEAISTKELMRLRDIAKSAEKQKKTVTNKEGKQVQVDLGDDEKKAWIQAQVNATKNERIVRYKKAMDLLGSLEEAAKKANDAEQEKIVSEMSGYAQKRRFWRAAGAQDAADELRSKLKKSSKDKFIEDAEKLFKDTGLGGDAGGGGGGGGGGEKPPEGGAEKAAA